MRTNCVLRRWRRGLMAAASVALCTVGVTAAHATAPPSVHKVSPASGPTAGGARVTVTGTGFTGVTAVNFGSASGRSVHITSSSKLTVVAPRHSGGVANVRVVTRHGTSAIRTADRFTYVARPTITGVSPTAGAIAGSTEVTIAGHNFVRVTSVKFGTAKARPVTVTSSRKLTVTAPAHAAGTVQISVRTKYGTSASVTADQYTYIGPPSVTTLVPASGGVAGGARVTLTGANFVKITRVAFGSTVATALTVTSSRKLTVTAPKHASGPVDVRVTGAYGTSTIVPADRFTYVDWTAMKAPIPAGAPILNYAEFAAISCATATTCVAAGGYLGTDHIGHGLLEAFASGSWKPVDAPRPVDARTSEIDLSLADISCATATECVAVGADVPSLGASQRGLIETLSNGTWTPTVAPAPSSETASALSNVVCASASLCVAIGTTSGGHALIETRAGGANIGWTAADVVLPVNYDTTTRPDLNSMTCDSNGACTVVGDYTDTDNLHHPLTLTRANQAWTVRALPLPADHTTVAGPDNGITNVRLNSVSCATPSACIAVGNYADSAGGLPALRETLSGGTWTASRPTMPSDAAAPGDGFYAGLSGIECPSAGTCFAAGDYDNPHFTGGASLLDTLSAGVWNPRQAPASGPAMFSSVSRVRCTSTQSCTAIGSMTTDAWITRAVIDTLADGAWASTRMPLPGDAPAAPDDHTVASVLSALSCPAPNSCIAVGNYLDSSGVNQPLIETHRP
jgi:hypothetical protein